MNIIDKKGVEDSETLIDKNRMWKYRETTNSSKVFNKNNQLNQSQPWGLGLIFQTEQNRQGRLIQISPKHTEQSGVDYDYAQAIEGSGYISWGSDNGGRYIEFKYHEFSSVSPAASYGYTFKTYIQRCRLIINGKGIAGDCMLILMEHPMHSMTSLPLGCS